MNNSNILPPATPTPPARAGHLPAYALYGEGRGAVAVDLLHIESIAQRSRLHGWEIRPHRHESLFQILVLRAGQIEARLDDQVLAMRGPCTVTVPALAAHGFCFRPDVDGWVFTLQASHLGRLLGADQRWQDTLVQLRGWPLPDGEVASAAQALQADYHGHDRWRAQAVDTALRRLLLALARTAPDLAPAGEAPPPRALAHVQRLRALVDAQFRQQPTLASLAATIGVTPTQINRVCHQVLGHSALGVLHARLLLEAQRDLRYTTMSIKQVALDLGFSDAGYFTRFFQRLTGQTPSAWRTASTGTLRP